MKLSDYKGEEALEVLADIIEPLSIIITDEEIQKMASKKDAAPIKYIKPMLKNHKREVIEVLARLENKPVEEYEKEMNLFTLPSAILSLINDPEVKNLFRSQGQTQVTSLASSGSATENTEAEKN